jgi:hypothetical protein
MNMKVANGGFCARKEESYCMDASVVDDVATYGIHPYKKEQHKYEILSKRLAKEE